MPEVGNLRASLSANSAQFEKDMNRARNAVRKNAKGMETSMDRVGKKFAAAGAAMNKFGAYAVAGAAVAAAGFIKQQIDVADKMGKLAQSTGTTSEYLSSMALVASQAGTTLEVVAKASNRLSMNMADMRRGVGESKEAFEDLGIVVADDAGVLRSTDDVMKDIADRFADMQDGADKTALAMRIFGKAGAELIPMLNMGSAGISDLQAKAEEMGLVISTKTALEAAYLNDQLDILQNRALGAGRSIAVDLIPWLNGAISAMAAAREESGTLMAAWVGLGAIGDALYTDSTQKKLREAKEDLYNVRIAIEEYEAANMAGGTNERTMAKFTDSLKSAQDEVDRLTRLLSDEAAAEDRAKEAALERQRKEAEGRRINTEAMRAQAEQRLRDAQLAREQEAAEKGRARESAAAVKAIEDQIRSLELQAATYGMTSAQIEIYTLKMKGATAAQIESAEAALADIEAKRAQADAANQLAGATGEAGGQMNGLAASTRSATDDMMMLINASANLMNAMASARKESGFYTDMEGLRAQSNINKEIIRQLRVYQGELVASANAAGNASAATVAAMANVEAEIVRLSAKTDLVANKMRGIFEDAFADGFEDIINGTKSFGDAMIDIVNNIAKEISRIVARELSQEAMKLLGGGLEPGKSQGLFSWIGSMFAGPDVGSDIVGIGQSIVGFDGGGYTGDGARAGGLDGKGGYLAMVHPNETVVDHTTGQSAGGVSVNVNISGVRDEGGLRKTAAQIAQQSGLAAQRAMARNG